MQKVKPKLFKIYMEYKNSSGERGEDIFLGTFDASSFDEACQKALANTALGYSPADFSIVDGVPMCNGLRLFVK